MTKVSFPINVYTSVIGDPTHPLFSLNMLGLATLKTEYKDNIISFSNITDLILFTVTTAKGVVAYGGEVYNYPVFLRCTTDVLSSEVPEGIPHRTITDEEGNTTVKTWENWTTVASRTVSGSTDIAFPLHLSGQDYIKGSEWVPLDSLDGYTILSEAEYRGLAPTDSEL